MRRPRRRFYFNLALALGMPVSELLQRVSAPEMAEWLAFFDLEPFGPRMDDLRCGIVASTIANVNRGKGAKAFAPKDFTPWADDEQHYSGPEREARAVERLIHSLGVPVVDARDKKRGE